MKDGTKDYPWVVKIRIRVTNTSNFKICTGTLISKNRIASAKHCFEGKECGIVQFFKKTSKDRGRFQRNIKYYQIPDDSDSDYAEAVLDQPVMNPAPVEVCQRDPKVGTWGLAVGWGLKEHNTPTTYLQRAWLQIIKNNGLEFETRVLYGKNNNIIKDPCAGDSGGPILAQINNKFCIFATVSGGGYFCDKNIFSGNQKWNDLIPTSLWNNMLSMRKVLGKKKEIKYC